MQRCVKMGIPTIPYEAIVVGGELYLAPACGIRYEEPTQENASRFELPSTTESYSGELYQFYEDSLKGSFREPEALLQFTRKQLEDSVTLMRSLNDDVVRDLEARIFDNYDGHNMPRHEYTNGREIGEEGRRSVASQFAKISIRGKLSQPVRKAYAALSVAEESAVREQFYGMIGEFLGVYRTMAQDGTLHPFAREKAQQFVTGFEKAVKRDADVGL